MEEFFSSNDNGLQPLNGDTDHLWRYDGLSENLTGSRMFRHWYRVRSAVQGFLLRPTKVSPYSLLITTQPPPPHGLPCQHHDCHNSNTTTPRIGRDGHVCTWSKFLGGFYNNYFFSVRMFTVLDQTRLWSMCQSKIFNPHGNNIWKYNISECKVQYVKMAFERTTGRSANM